MKKILIAAAVATFLVSAVIAQAAQRPNLVLIMADDLGYGDVQCLNLEHGKIKTPCADQLAKEGMIFTDAHSGSSVCTPARYGLMTGRYSWRTRLQRGVVTGFAASLIAKDRSTVASFLKLQGYTTGIIGKWHLDFQYLDPKSGARLSQKDHKLPPVGATIPDGPLHRGFDYYHGFHHARHMEAVIENDRVIQHDNVDNMLPRLTRKSVEFIARQAGKKAPFFLYVPLGSPHTPIVPTPEWVGQSGLGKYGDFVMQTDNVVGEISAALDKHGLANNTLVIFTSDNGCSKAADIPALASQGHQVSAHLRGSKADIWDGGHRIPFIVRWPGKVEPGTTSDQLICLTDLFVTTAEITGREVPRGSCEDSVSFLPALAGQKIESSRPGVIHHSISGHFAYRQGKWKLVLAKASGGWSSPNERSAPSDAPKAQLYDMAADPGETNNLYLEKPEIAQRLLAQLGQEVTGGRSTAGPASDNDVEHIVLWKSEQGGGGKRRGGRKKPKAGSNPKTNTQPVAVTPVATNNKRPNFLFILVDDQSPFDLRVYDPQSPLQTPTIDRLAAEGMVFDGAYHMGSFSGAVCTPSRHMIMTGRTVWHLPNALGGRHCPADIEQNVMAAVFNRAGYDTMRTCKKGNSYGAANRQFTVVRDATKRGGTAETGSAWHGQQVLDYLNQREVNQDHDPFLIYFGFSHPHDTRDGTPELLASYGAVNHKDKKSLPPAHPKQPPLPVNYLPQHPFHHGHPRLRDEVAVSGVWERRDEQTIRNELGREFACSQYIDQQIARVVQKLDAMGELDNTFIIYTSDHGMAIGRHGLQGKQNLYQHTWRVPFIVKGPGIQPGKRVEGNTYLLDVLPTLCDLAGIDVPSSVEGLSVKPVLDGKTATVRDVLFGVYCGGTKPGMRSVKQGDWKLIKYDVMDGAVRETQLFNLKDNPDELLGQHHDPQVIKLTANTPQAKQVNLADDPQHADKLAEMEALLLSEMRRLDDPYRLWDQPDDGVTPPPAKPRKKRKKQKAS
ncbi:MAG: sulfatase-like hydrolase/transferase [Planctomycetota bacterium]|nr:sulfatase-like hydrolase/transferase [Planctomycetota bacterium]